jgi:hypothetical protein
MRPERGALALFDHPAGLPEGGAALFASGLAEHVCLGRPWFETIAAHAMPDGARPCFALATDAAGPFGMLALERGAAGWRALSTPYTTLWAPLLGAPDPARAETLGRRLGALLRGQAVTRLDALAAESPLLAPFSAGLRAGGLAVRRFDHFGNWHEPVAGLDWAAYLAKRPGSLRETVRRKLARVAREKDCRFEVIAGPDRLEPGIAAYEQVYARSWKEPEPFPRFNAALMRALAPGGTLRLGLLWRGATPIAAQFWAVAYGRAIVFKLAHDEAHKPLSPGTVLTAMMLRRLLDEEHVSEIDFGRGDDPYKQLWTSRRRMRIGLLAIDARRPAGLAALAADALGRARRRWRG